MQMICTSRTLRNASTGVTRLYGPLFRGWLRKLAFLGAQLKLCGGVSKWTPSCLLPFGHSKSANGETISTLMSSSGQGLTNVLSTLGARLLNMGGGKEFL